MKTFNGLVLYLLSQIFIDSVTGVYLRPGQFYPVNGETDPLKSEAKSSGAIRDVIKRNSPRYRKVLIRNSNNDVIFSNEDAHYMTSRAKSKLDILASLVRNRLRTRIRVIQAWTDNVDPNDKLSLHYEGRALMINLENNNQNDFHDLIDYAFEAGFEWVWRKTQSAIHISVIPDVCQTKLDLAFIVDTSGSVQYKNFVRVQEFLKKLIDFFNIGREETHVALISYSYSVRVEFPLNRYYDKRQLKDAIDRMHYQGSNTATGDALMTMVRKTFTEGQGMRKDKSIPKIGILLTDGKSNGGVSVWRASQIVKDAGINMFVIGVTRNVRESEARQIASAPFSEHYIQIERFTELSKFVDKISTVSCDEGAQISQCEKAESDIDGGSFRYFRVQFNSNVRSVSVEVTDINGQSFIYASLIESNPGPLSANTYKSEDAISPRTISINLPYGQTNILYVAVQGQKDHNKFSLSIWDSLFPENQKKVTILEEQQGKIFVTKVQARNTGDRFKYFIKDGNKDRTFFLHESDQLAGELYTIKPIDREITPMRQLSIVAQDVKEPCHKGLMVLTVIAKDINDNSPKFETVKPVSIREDVPKNQYITQVRATDKDSGENGRLFYSLKDFSDVFQINTSTGVIRLRGNLDYETKDTYDIPLEVRDGGVPSRAGYAQLRIKIEDVNEEPRFTGPSCFLQNNCDVKIEEEKPAMNVNIKFTATDPDVRRSCQLTYKIVSLDQKYFTVDPRSGQLRTNGPLDRELKETYVLDVAVLDCDNPPLMDVKKLIVKAIDINDNKPIFTRNLYEKGIPEDTPVNTEVIAVLATDADSGLNGKISYTLENKDEPGVFRIDSNTGKIYLSKKIDYELGRKTYELLVTARDNGSPKTFSGTAKVLIKVIDVNDNVPEISGPFQFEISENVGSNFVVATVPVKDKDSGLNAAIDLSISDPQKMFSISNNGILKTLKNPDRENRDNYVVTITATDNGRPPLKTSKTFTIKIKDENDNNPIFQQSVYSLVLIENTPVSSKALLTVLATDKDIGKNKEIIYKLENSPFNIDEAKGTITLTKPLDFGSQQNYDLKLTAQDKGVPSLKGVATFKVTLKDSNDFTPKFEQSNYVTEIDENVPLNFKVITVQAKDDDKGPSGNIDYVIEKQDVNGVFFINKNTGTIYTQAQIDYEKRTSYKLTIRAKDSGKPSKSSTCQVQVNIKDMNDNSPVFDSKKLQIIENSKMGTTVGQLTGSDKDSGKNAEFGFTITTPNTPFGISNTGVVSVAKAIDRELKDMYKVTVEIRDKGSPSLFTRKSVTIEIIDENDNTPMFSNKEFTCALGENRKAGSHVCNILATDRDAGLNGEVKYSLVTSSIDVTINQNTGEVTTLRPLDRERDPQIILQVKAEDKGTKKILSNETRLTINVFDENDNSPVCKKGLQMIAVEESAKTTNVIAEIEASDADINNNGLLDYVIERGDKTMFSLVRVSNEKVNVQSEPLDREKRDNYDLYIRVSDRGPGRLSAVCRVKIKVTDINDNTPKFTSASYYRKIKENVRLGTLVLKITATDEDINENGLITYEKLEGTNNEHFSLDKDTGEIRTAKDLDFEKIKKYDLTVRIHDNGKKNQFTEIGTVVIDVINVDDNAPQFEKVKAVNVSEDAYRGFPVVQFSATDADGSSLTFSIVGGNNENKFEIDSTSGKLTVLNTLDRETTSSYLIVVEATDGVNPVNEKLPVTILDINDNVPIFDKPSYQASLDENKMKASVVKVFATDKDEGLNKEIIYTIDDDNKKYFTINSDTGEISTVGTLDREMIEKHKIKVTATDRGTPSLSSSVVVTVTVNDLNDNAPKFERDPYNLDIVENTGVQANVVVVKATDPDAGKNAVVKYRLKSGDTKFFTIDENSGQVKTLVNLDRETKDSYKLTIEAYDQGQTSLSKSVNIEINVLDMNDNKPIIKEPVSFPGVNESEPIGFVITTVKATDDDIGKNKELKYFIEEMNNENFFEIDQITGVIKLKKKLEREVKDKHSIVVKVKDSGTPSLTGIGRYEVTVLDANNQPPIFTKEKYTGTVGENDMSKPIILQVETTDLDTPPNAQNRYSLENDMDVFQINPLNGKLSAVGTIDYEKNPSYKLNIIASDWKYKVSVPAEITVINYNDNNPRFTKDSYVKTISEDMKIGESVLQVNATDPDPFGPLVYSIESNVVDLPFNIDSSKGIIKVSKSLDRETKASYDFSVVVHDSGNPSLSSKASVKIYLKDVNDNAPYFDKNSVEVTLYENKPAGTRVTQAEAFDRDLNGKNEIRYFAEPNQKNSFEIDIKSGLIKTTRPFDREIKEDQKLSFKIRARDFGNLKSDVFTVYVTVLDENDNKPEWDKKVYSGKVKEHTTTGINIIKVSATDKDLGKNALVNYYIKEKDTPFIVKNHTGIVSLAKDIDRETLTSDEITITLIARDNGDVPLESETRLVVEIEDINDHAPIIDQDSLKGSVYENEEKPLQVAQVKASDKDIGKNAELEYKMESNDLFTIDGDTGKVQAIRPLDREEKSYYEITVTVTDKGSPSLKTNGILNITVLDVDDNCPVFLKKEYNVRVMENMPRGTTVLKVEASDRDIGENARLNFGIIGATDGGAFDINPDTGEIFVLGNVDAEYEGNYTLKIRAGSLTCGVQENATNVGEGETPVENNSTYALVIIHPINVNDNPPRFTISLDKIIFDDPNTVNVTRVTAIDPDGDDNIIFYSARDETTQKIVGNKIENHILIHANDNGNPPQVSNRTVIVSNKIPCDAMLFSVAPTGEVTVQTLCSVTNHNSGTITLDAAENMNFKCTATGNSKTQYEWLKDGVYTGLSDNGDYNIKNVKVENAGIYSCLAKSVAGTILSETTTLIVHEKPQAVVQPENTTVTIGNDAKLRFVASGTPKPIYQWFKDGNIFNEGGKKSELLLEDSVAGDSAIYYCIAKNAAGEIKSKEVELRIVDPENVVKMKLNTFDKNREKNCSNFFPDELEKHLTTVLDKKVVVTKVKVNGKIPLCKKNACSKNPCENSGKCDVDGDTYKCVCQKNWAGKNCREDYNECTQDTNICYNGGDCRNLIGSFSCGCPKNYSGHRCQYKRDACANATCTEETEICVPSSSRNGFSCVNKKNEVTIVIDRKSNFTGANEKFDIEDLLNQILKLQPSFYDQNFLYSSYAATQSIDFSGCTIHILNTEKTTDGKTEVRVAVDCYNPDSNDTSGFSPSTVKKLCTLLLQQGKQVQACGQGKEIEKKEPEEVKPTEVVVEVISETGEGKTNTAEETLKTLNSKDLDLEKINLESIDINKGKSESKKDDHKKTIVIGIVCGVLGIMIIVIVLVIYHRRRQPTNKHTLILQQRSVVSHDGGEMSPRTPGNYRENLAYTDDGLDSSKGFMFEMPSNLKTTEDSKK